MTYKNLLNQLQQLNEEQLDREIVLYDFEQDLILDGQVTAIRINEWPSKIIDKGTPYLVF